MNGAVRSAPICAHNDQTAGSCRQSTDGPKSHTQLHSCNRRGSQRRSVQFFQDAPHDAHVSCAGRGGACVSRRTKRPELLTREPHTREPADTGRPRAEFLAEASAILAGSLNYETTLHQLAQLVVPELADWCIVYGLLPSGAIKRLEVVANSPAGSALQRWLSSHAAGDWLRRNRVAARLLDGRPVLEQTVSDSLLAEVAKDEEHLTLLRAARFTSLMAVPLRGQEALLGAMVFLSAESGRRYTREDLDLAMALAQHAVLAIDNARVHEELEARVRQRTTELSQANAMLRAEIAERQRIEEALRVSEQKFRSIVETTQEWIWSIDRAGRIVYSNPAVEKILGYRVEEVMGTDSLRYLHEEDRERVLHLLPIWIAEQQGWTGLVLRRKHKSGGYRYLESNGLAILDDDESVRGFWGTDRDITDRMQLEAQLHQSQKLEALGRLAGGVAHDFNNLLMVVLGQCQILERRLADVHLRQASAAIRRAVDRATAVTQQLLAFGRRQVLRPVVVDLNAVVRNMEALLRRGIGEHIELVTKLCPGELRVRADLAQIEQVVMNLILNARDAMPNGGTLTLETDRYCVGEGVHPPCPDMGGGEYAVLKVGDTGMGMDPETQARVFEPFFTTKPAGEGTGLGLATVHGIVRQGGGYISVTSEIAQGSLFAVYLPWDDGDPDDLPYADSDGILAERGVETILLVEDEDDVRALAREALQERGYSVIEARHGAEAILLSQNYPDPIHLMLTDVVMPGMSGLDLAFRLRASRPSMKVLYMSGYPGDDVLRDATGMGPSAFLQKPLTPAGLAQRVRACLDGRRLRGG